MQVNIAWMRTGPLCGEIPAVAIPRLMAGFTGDGEPDMDAYREQSAAVKCIVDWYGPTDIAKMNYYPSSMDHTQADSPEALSSAAKMSWKTRSWPMPRFP